MSTVTKDIDILCVGETLIDFIGTQKEQPISGIKDYHRYLGGSPTNVAMNMSRFGMNVAMVASVGNDGFGSYILERFLENNIDVSGVKRQAEHPTTVIFISRTEHSPEFVPMRGADSFIDQSQLSESLLSRSKVFHTTCFALSQKPAQQAILEAAAKAYNQECQLSIDINYSEKIWGDRQEALAIIKAYCSYGPMIKASEDDIERLFGRTMSHDQFFKTMHGWGAKVICLTLGKDGAKLSEPNAEVLSLEAFKVEQIMDATGAGDAFWSGFLFAYLKDKPLSQCMATALQAAAIKLQNVGRVPDYASLISSVFSL